MMAIQMARILLPSTFDVLPVNDFARFNPSDGIAPVLASASLSPVDSKTINLYFTESMDSGVVLENNTFVVKDSGGNTFLFHKSRLYRLCNRCNINFFVA